MSAPKSGGPAFPNESHIYSEQRTGMTLRDYFAAKAMQGICSHSDTWGCGISDIAAQAYSVADAMLAARVKP